MTQTSIAPTGRDTRMPASPLATRGQLPRWAPPAVFAGALGVVVLLGLAYDLNIALYALYTVVLGTGVLFVLSRVVEGRRKSLDRLVTCGVVSAFAVAMVPLLSLVFEVVSRGVARLDGQFFNS